MKLHYLLEKFAFPLLILSLFFVLTTFLNYFTQGGEWQRLFGFNLHRILQLLDLREENTLATWFSSIIFLVASLSLLLLGWGHSPEYQVSRFTRFIFQLGAIGACLLSADEVASIHETVGKTVGRFIFNLMVAGANVEDQGFFWVPLFAPLLLIVFLAIAHSLYQVIANLPNPYGQRQSVLWTLLIALICLPGVFVLEALEAHKDTLTVLTCVEETVEIIGMYSLFLGSLMIARQYKL